GLRGYDRGNSHRQIQSRRELGFRRKSWQGNRGAFALEESRQGHLRPGRFSLSRKSESSRGRGARRRTQILKDHGTTTQRRRQTAGTPDGQKLSGKRRHDREGRVHQSLREGRQRRPAFQL